MATNTGDSTNNNNDTQSGNTDAKSTIPLVIEEGKLTTVSAVVSRTGDGLAFASVSSETTPIQPRQSEGDSDSGGDTDTSGGDGQSDGQTTPTPRLYYTDPECPIENIFYDEVFAYGKSQGVDGEVAAVNHAIYFVFRRGQAIDQTEWSLTMTDVNGAITMAPSRPNSPNPKWIAPSAQTYSGGVSLRESPRLLFRFTRRYQTSRTGLPAWGVSDARMNEMDCIDKADDDDLADCDTNEHVADRGVPPRMNLTITFTHHGNVRRWTAIIDVQVKGLDGNATDVPTLRPQATQLCKHERGIPPEEYREGRLPAGVIPSRDDCREIKISADSSEIEYIKPDPLPMIWNQLTESERRLNPQVYRSIGFNSTVTARFNGGFRLFDPDRIALEVVEVSPVKAASDSLAAEVSFNGTDWRALKLMGRLVKGNEAAERAGSKGLFYIIWRFAGLPRELAVTAGSGFRVRVRDLSIHVPSLSASERAGGQLPQPSGHPFWRYGPTTEKDPGSDLTDIVVLSNPLQKIRYLFVLDHSGSMAGSRITSLRKAMKSALIALEKAVREGTVEIEIGLRIFQHARANSAAEDLTRFSGWQSLAGYTPPANLTPPETEPAPCAKHWIPDPASPAGKLLTWLCRQSASGQTPLQQAVEKIPEDLGSRDPEFVDFVILLSDGMHTGLVMEDDPENPGQQREARRPEVRAGAAGLARVVGANQLPDKMFIVGLELADPDKQSIEFMRDETPVYLDEDLIKYMTEAGVSPAHQNAFLAAMRRIAVNRNYVTYGEMRTELRDNIPAATIPAATATLIREAAKKRAKDRVDVRYVSRSSDLTKTFLDFIREFVTGSRGCLKCEAPRQAIESVTSYKPPAGN